jgi:SAM-dependent methyltransferase
MPISDSAAVPPPDAVMRHAMGFQPARLVLSALELGLFELLSEAPADEETIRAHLGLHPRGTRDFLRALVTLDLVDEADGRYRNAPAADTYLIPGRDRYQGAFLHMVNQVMYPTWGRLTEGLRTGAPQSDLVSGEDIFGEWYGSSDERRRLIGWTEEITRPLLRPLAAALDWTARRSVLELGCMRGNLLAHLVHAHPHLDARGFDLPQLAPAFEENMAAQGLAGRIEFHGGDFFADPLPTAEVVVLGQVLVDWGVQERRQLVKNTFPAVAPGGILAVYDPMVAGDGNDLANHVISLTLQLMTPGGSGYAVGDCVGWMRDAGYVDVTHRPLAHITMVVGHRPD